MMSTEPGQLQTHKFMKGLMSTHGGFDSNRAKHSS